MCPMKRYAIGVDIGGSHLTAAAVELLSGEVVPDSVAVSALDTRAGASEILEVWAETIGSAFRMVAGSVEGIGIAIPGPFDYGEGSSTICGVEKYDRIFGLNLTLSLVVRISGADSCRIRYVNDASAFALGESLGGALKGVRRGLALTLGTGLGSGFLLDGRLVTHGEGVPPEGWVYCLPYEGAIADDAFTTRWFLRRYRELTGREATGVREIAGEADRVPEAAAVFSDYGERLGAFTASLCEGFPAEAVVLGGNISRAFDRFAPAMCRVLAERGCRARVSPSASPDRATLVGAASLFL